MVRPRALFIGRWQPYHKGHEWLIDQKKSQGIPILIAIRDIPPDDSNPLTSAQVMRIINTRYIGHDVKVIIIPDIESVNWGRAVGYGTQEWPPPPAVYNVSASDIRKKILSQDETWRENIHKSIQPIVASYLMNGI